MILFIANTYSQLINASVIAKSKFYSETCDLYCKEEFLRNYKKLCKNIFNKCYIYPELYIINRKENNLLSDIRTAFEKGMRYKKLVDKMPSNVKEYKKIFLSSKSLAIIQIYYAIKLINSEVELNLYEEGAFEYCELEEKPKYLEIVFSLFFFKSYYLWECKNMYVYRAELINSRWKNIKLNSIPSLYHQTEILKLFTEAFKCKPESLELKKGSIIYLEQAGSDKMDILQLDILKRMISDFGKENIVIKLHPKSSKYKYGKELNYFEFDIPLELLITNKKVETYIFITIYSSAALNINLMTDYRPTVIYLYNFFECKDSINKVLSGFIDKLAKLPEHSNIRIPKTLEEMKNELAEGKKRNEQ